MLVLSNGYKPDVDVNGLQILVNVSYKMENVQVVSVEGRKEVKVLDVSDNGVVHVVSHVKNSIENVPYKKQREVDYCRKDGAVGFSFMVNPRIDF